MQPPPVTSYSSYYALADVYRNLRDLILHLPIQWQANGSYGTVGALMETGHLGAIATLVSLTDGTTSLYLSSGGSVTGMGRHASVAAATRAFVDAVEASMPAMTSALAYPVPQPRTSRFYLLSTAGSWTAEEMNENLAKKASPLSPMFFKAHAVINAIREVAPPPME